MNHSCPLLLPPTDVPDVIDEIKPCGSRFVLAAAVESIHYTGAKKIAEVGLLLKYTLLLILVLRLSYGHFYQSKRLHAQVNPAMLKKKEAFHLN